MTVSQAFLQPFEHLRLTCTASIREQQSSKSASSTNGKGSLRLHSCQCIQTKSGHHVNDMVLMSMCHGPYAHASAASPNFQIVPTPTQVLTPAMFWKNGLPSSLAFLTCNDKRCFLPLRHLSCTYNSCKEAFQCSGYVSPGSKNSDATRSTTNCKISAPTPGGIDSVCQKNI